MSVTSQTRTTCAHCGLPATSEGPDVAAFCCEGCRTAHVLLEAGLALVPPRAVAEIPYDDADFLATVTGEPGPRYVATFALSGLYCPSCTRLIERACTALAGISEVKAHYSAGQLNLSWDQSQTPLSEVARCLAGLGYGLLPLHETTNTQRRRTERRQWALRLAVGGFAATSVGFMSEALTWSTFGASAAEGWMLLALLCTLISTPTFAYVGWPFLRGAYHGLRLRVLGMDLTIALGATATYLASLHSVWQGHGPLYFDSLTMFLFLIAAGRWTEAWGRERAAAAADRLLPPPFERAKVKEGDLWVDRPAALVRAGDRLLVAAGELCPVDGTIVAGRAELDEAVLTGESRPIPRLVGERVHGGTRVIDGVIEVDAEQVGAATTLSRLRRLAEQAATQRGPLHDLADRAAHWLVLVILAAAALTAWWWRGTPELALLHAVSILIVTCPCALGLATPTALALATAGAWRQGVLIKDGGAFERLGRLTHLVLDKTGTVTSQAAQVLRVIPAAGTSPEALLAAAAAVTAPSGHPLAKAIAAVAGAPRHGLADGWRNETGSGISGLSNGRLVRAGRLEWLATNGVKLPRRLLQMAHTALNHGQSVVWISEDDRCLGLFLLATPLREDAVATVRQLQASGVAVTLLSGDSAEATSVVAHELGVSSQGAVTPDGKLAAIRALRSPGRVVAMVGDGINDAPALAAADLGIAMGSGTGLAIETAPIVLLGDQLTPLATAVNLARRTRRIIWQNLALSALYNAVALPVAMSGQLTPAIAAILMPVSSLLVLANTMRLAGRDRSWKSSA